MGYFQHTAVAVSSRSDLCDSLLLQGRTDLFDCGKRIGGTMFGEPRIDIDIGLIMQPRSFEQCGGNTVTLLTPGLKASAGSGSPLK